MLITLSGLDGAGKSTLAEALRASLAKEGIPAVVCHMNWQMGLYALLRGFRDFLKRMTGMSVPDRLSTAESDGTTPRSTIGEWKRRVVWNKGVRRWVDLADLAAFAVYRVYIEKVTGRVLIMDRYFYDRLTDLADGRRWTYLRAFARLVPVPDVPVLVEVSPEVAFARKGEFSVESMSRRQAHYREVFSWVPSAVSIANDRLDRATDELRSIVLERIALPGRRNLAVER